MTPLQADNDLCRGLASWRVQLFELDFDGREAEAAAAVVRSGWISMGQQVLRFETEFAKSLGSHCNALAVSSGTAALHLALLALGVGPGDEVIVPALTFVADLNVIRMVGAEPILADSTSIDDWTVDPADVERKVTSRTKAIIAVHFAGFACDMDRVLEVAGRYGLGVVEDCAHAHGTTFKGRPVGTFGTVSAWSFFANKNLPMGEGGMLVSKSDEIHLRCARLRSHGMTLSSLERMKGTSNLYDVTEPGLNYRMSEVGAAIARVQLGKLEESNRRRSQLVARYRERLGESKVATVPFTGSARGLSSHHIMPVLLPEGLDRAAIIRRLNADGIQTSIHYPFPANFTAYRDVRGTSPLARHLASRELTLPLFPSMRPESVDLVCNCLEAAIV